VLPISTKVRAGFSMRIEVEPDPENALRVASPVPVDWPQMVRLSGIGLAVGDLDTATMRAITRQMAVVLGGGTGSGRPRRTGAARVAAIEPSDTR